ncbi:hypothetical protein EDD11_008776 [Mortierella claussenii]|nr:hypothetical protein EDD11_008776 [Mortierella claussenii]
MKFATFTAVALTVFSTSSSIVSAGDYAIAAFSQSNCLFSSAIYTHQQSGTDFQCKQFNGKTAQGVAWNGDNYWCVGLYSDNNCKNQVKYLKGGVSGCQSGSFQSYFIYIPSHGFPC